MDDVWKIKTLRKAGLALQILPGIGGRLWDVVHEDRSILFKNGDLDGRVPDLTALSDLPTRSPQFAFPLWGGEKTWVAPDTSWVDNAPFPVLDSGPDRVQSFDANHIHMRSEVCPISKLQIERTITIGSTFEWSISHKIFNRGSDVREVGVWSVLMLDRPVQMGLVADHPRIKNVFGNADGQIQTARGRVICDCCNAIEFKVGIDNAHGRILLRIGKSENLIWLLCTTNPRSNGDRFAHAHNFEIFNSVDYPYCEAEWHSPTQNLGPGENIRFDQSFALWSQDRPAASPELSTSELELMRCMS